MTPHSRNPRTVSHPSSPAGRETLALLHLRRQDWSDDPHQRKKRIRRLAWIALIFAGIVAVGMIVGAGFALLEVMWR